METIDLNPLQDLRIIEVLNTDEHETSDERVEFYYGDTYIGNTSYDVHGFRGAAHVEDMMKRLAKAVGIRVVEEDAGA